jgi:hypothetical protein
LGDSNSRYSHSLGLDRCRVIPRNHDDSQQQKEGCEGQSGSQQEEDINYGGVFKLRSSYLLPVCIDA